LEAPPKEQGRSPGKVDSCGTRKIDRGGLFYTTNDVSGCPDGGVLRGTERDDRLAGEDGEDEVYGLGGGDTLEGGVGADKVYGGPGDDWMMGAGALDHDEAGDDLLYGGPGRDELGGDRGDDVLYGGAGGDHVLHGGEGEDVLNGGEGDDQLSAFGDGQRDELYCGDGEDGYTADEIDVVADDCEPAETTVLGGLECANSGWVGGSIDYAAGARGEKGTPVEAARRDFPQKIEEGDTVQMIDRSRGQNARATVRVIREGRVVALIDYRRAGGGWLQDYYEACGDF
jgi:Ca2+-binding RTX toxin-like protein